MKDVKYVIVDGCAIIFSAAITHSDMVRFGKKADGAGFVRFHISKDEYDEDVVIAKCYGESISLGVESRGEEDSLIVTSQICGNL